MRTTQQASFPLLALTALVAAFMLAPIALSVMAGLVNNYSTGISSGLTTRWLHEVCDLYGGTVGWSLSLALRTMTMTRTTLRCTSK